MKQSIKQSRVLDKTIKYFNLKTRNASVVNACKYYPVHENSEGCAVGRLIKDKELCKRLDKASDSSVLSIFKRLPLEVQELGKSFLYQLQLLHDNKTYWNEKGLSEFGKRRVKEIKKDFKLN